jgi:hypothetical protein
MTKQKRKKMKNAIFELVIFKTKCQLADLKRLAYTDKEFKKEKFTSEEIEIGAILGLRDMLVENKIKNL